MTYPSVADCHFVCELLPVSNEIAFNAYFFGTQRFDSYMMYESRTLKHRGLRRDDPDVGVVDLLGFVAAYRRHYVPFHTSKCMARAGRVIS